MQNTSHAEQRSGPRSVANSVNRSLRARKRTGPTAAAKKKDAYIVSFCRHDIAIEWRDLRDSPRAEKLAEFVKLIALCKKSKIDELVVQNILPTFRVGTDEPALVLGVQDEIVPIAVEAAVWCKSEPPEWRLSLRRGMFDIRFYLGRARPTDYLHWDDRD